MSTYEARGVSAGKEEVHAAIKNLDKGLFPNAFCKILPDFVGKKDDWCNIMHADTAGTKTALAYMYWKETGDVSVWKGIVQDAIVMNLDDMACVGCVDDIILSSTIGRNKSVITGEVIKTIIEGCTEFLATLKSYGVNVELAGGETADVGDIVRTIDVGYTAFARMKREELLVNRISGGEAIVGIASFGQSKYENAYNSGIGSNGLTSARHDVLNKDMGFKYPECVDPNLPEEVVFCGSKSITDKSGISDYSVSELLLSPTRTYLPLLKQVLEMYKSDIKGMIHCTGGAQTKVLHFIDNIRVVKNHLLPVPPVFEMIQKESNANWKEMYRVFNMGHRLEIYTDQKTADGIIALARSMEMDAQIIGYTEPAQSSFVEIESEKGHFTYQ